MDSIIANEFYISNADRFDLDEILALQKLCYQSEAALIDDYTIPPLLQTIDDLNAEFLYMKVLKITVENRIISSVRAFEKNGTAYIGKLIVDPAYQNKGIGSKLLSAVETLFDVNRYELFTGFKSERNLHVYNKAGYKEFCRETVNDKLTIVYLEKIV